VQRGVLCALAGYLVEASLAAGDHLADVSGLRLPLDLATTRRACSRSEVLKNSFGTPLAYSQPCV
jgi:hypothetical protein